MELDHPTAIGTGLGAALNGEVLLPAQALTRLVASPYLTCHTGFLVERLGQAAGSARKDVRAALEQRHFDVAELFAFVCPALTAVPTPRGLARILASPARQRRCHHLACRCR